MENKPSTQAPDTGDDTQALRSSTNVLPKRPLVKSTPSKTSSLTRPTAASATKTATASGLSKPPTRPTTISSVRKTPSTSTFISGHQKRASLASTDAATSGDETKKTSGLSARPKRMSLAPTTSTSATRATAATAASRRSTIQPSPTSEQKPFVRQSTSSPTKTRTTPSTPSSRIISSTATRSRPLTSSTSSLRNTGISDGKKRLSTIPASPAVKTGSQNDDKENTLESVPEATEKPGRPTIDARQSTRSVALAQRIREFEIVNQMLQVAMAQEGDDEGQEQAQREAAVTVGKLKADLAQVVDEEAVEAQVEDVEIPEPSFDSTETSGKHATVASNDEEVGMLKEQLSESRSLVGTLTADLEQLKDKLAVFSASAEEESTKVQAATEAIRTKHAQKMEDLMDLHKQETDNLHAEREDELKQKEDAHGRELEALQAELAAANTKSATQADATSEVRSLKDAHAKEVDLLQKKINETDGRAASREDDVAVLKSELADAMASLDGHHETAVELENLKAANAKELATFEKQSEDALNSRIMETEALRVELEKAKKDLAAAQERSSVDIKPEAHQAALRELEEAKKNDLEKGRQSHLADMTELQAKFDQAHQASDDTTAQQKVENNRLHQVIEDLQQQIMSKDEVHTRESQDRIDAIKDSHEQAMAGAIEAATSSSTKETDTLRKELSAGFQTTIEGLQDELMDAREHAARITEDAKAAADEQTRALEAKVRNLQSEMEASKMQSATFKQILSSSEKENQEKDEEHAAAVDKLEEEVATSVKRATEQQMKVMDVSTRLDQEVARTSTLEKAHAKAIADMEAEHEALKRHHEDSKGDEIKSLKEQHAANIKDHRSKETAVTQSLNELQTKHDSLSKQLDVQQQVHDRSLQDLQTTHDRAFKEIQSIAEARQQEIDTLKSEYANAGESSKVSAAAHKQELESLQTKQDGAVKDLQGSLDDHIAQLTLLTTKNASHNEAMRHLQTSHDEQLQSIKSQHADGTVKMRSEAEDKDVELNKMTAQYAEMVQKLEVSSRRDEEFEKLTIQNTNMATELKSIEASHSAYLDELRKGYLEEIKTAESAAKMHAGELEQLKAQQQDFSKAAETSSSAHTKAIDELKSQHLDQLTKLQAASKDQAAELNKLKMQRGLVAEEATAKEASHSRAVKEIQAQHAATMEAMADAQVAEIERMKTKHAEALSKTTSSEKATEDPQAQSSKTAELVKEMQIKIASLEAELALSTKTDTPRSKSPKKASSKSINGNGSPGLAHSKWAQAEPTTPLKQEVTMRGGSDASPADAASPTDETEISSTAPTPGSVLRKHNIEGQLAGIQEQLKHLDDVDAEMLEQHERMARTLSRVDDVTGSVDAGE